ncbi:MAG TPA: hypothetical protein VF708_12600 [Pyrinomonadaceae bacterium]
MSIYLQHIKWTKRARIAPALMIALALLITSAACKQQGSASNTNTNNPSQAANDTSRTPPFSTREPERYQWMSVTTVSTFDREAGTSAPLNPNTSQVFVARDRDLRREDYELSPGVKVSFLQLPTGRYRLLHSKKLYAELGVEEGAPGQAQNVPPDFSPERLLNASRTEARYEKLGTEELNGRTTTKYRVTVRSEAGEARDSPAENLVWVDESLGVPVRTESTSPDGSRYTMELRDIKLDVEASMFALPSDYRKVASKDIDTELLSTYLLGGDRDETGASKKK